MQGMRLHLLANFFKANWGANFGLVWIKYGFGQKSKFCIPKNSRSPTAMFTSLV